MVISHHAPLRLCQGDHFQALAGRFELLAKWSFLNKDRRSTNRPKNPAKKSVCPWCWPPLFKKHEEGVFKLSGHEDRPAIYVTIHPNVGIFSALAPVSTLWHELKPPFRFVAFEGLESGLGTPKAIIYLPDRFKKIP